MNDDDDALVTIGQLARRLGVPVRTVRYWSDIGAVPPTGEWLLAALDSHPRPGRPG